jgi:hypothetical protein
MGKGDYAVLEALMGLLSHSEVKKWNKAMNEGLGFKFQPGDVPSREHIARQGAVLGRMDISDAEYPGSRLSRFPVGRRSTGCATQRQLSIHEMILILIVWGGRLG